MATCTCPECDPATFEKMVAGYRAAQESAYSSVKDYADFIAEAKHPNDLTAQAIYAAGIREGYALASGVTR